MRHRKAGRKLGRNPAQRQALFLAAEAVFHAPVPTAGRGQFQVKACAVKVFAGWGAFPGHTRNDVQSGIGVVHNGFLIEKPERTVVHGPFRPSPRSLVGGELSISPKPPWFVNNRTAAGTGRHLVSFAAKRSPAKLPAIFASALRG